RRADGSPLGAAAIELSLDFVVRTLLAGADAGDSLTLLLDAEGRVLASEDVLARTGGGDPRLERYADPALHAALARASVGTVDTDAAGHPETLAFARIQPTGWVLLTRHPRAR